MLLTAGTLAGCDSSSEAPSSDSADLPSHAFQGVYRMKADGSKLTDLGQPSPSEDWERTYASVTDCDGDVCVAKGVRVDDSDPSKVFVDEDGEKAVASTMDYVDGAWQLVEQAEWTCSDGSIGTQTVEWRLDSTDDGQLMNGTRTDVRVASPDCIVVMEQPFTMERIGDVDPALEVDEPAEEPPFERTGPAGLTGAYMRTATVADGKDGEADRSEVNFRSFCVRNTDKCIALKTFQVDGKTWTIPLSFSKGRWSVVYGVPQMNCPGSDMTAEQFVHEQYSLPDDAGNPIKSLSGSEVATLSGACAGTSRDFQLTLERTEGSDR
ncbi:hypothetical protein [Mycolicibacterium brumae]|uniref:Uncharacterized protein n=1 Tax=Mycolicibacterium brumae TaxID=85968 RepID=A0A2G5PEX5_9MYCO|nr:hypothetical protein [Mycolicibacterium brumae]MCV7191917.1 hypothetical protein [Mycolicibacterium brumae]PIB76869.1 hypothetical protein CQY22_004290 [Mycolicibacterium brumae]UWW07685.1 hypothetical protein L2Z93_000712 [Mycolicibacterium brumae]